jgi:hypothetical protein
VAPIGTLMVIIIVMQTKLMETTVPSLILWRLILGHGKLPPTLAMLHKTASMTIATEVVLVGKTVLIILLTMTMVLVQNLRSTLPKNSTQRSLLINLVTILDHLR